MPQRQRTEPEKDTGKELPDLTAQQEKFVHGVLSGMTATDAYRAAYDTSNMLNRTVWAEASRLNSHPDISAWLAAARMAGLGTAKVTLENHLAQLERIREIAIKSGNVGAAVAAEQSRGKATGHYVEQVRDVTDRFDAAQTLREIAQHSPELAASLAAQHGVAMPSDGVTKH